ncbi:acyl-CoA thioesterase [Novosphingobium rosa]|uniref:acyl-CoA thioesterase n=1 Tax=Novosphingobium rosa TaxID=76978 RepID=UPI000836392A|nr:thioesterase family protein [Novosphingobium rosa]
MSFTTTTRVRFADVDPAGIVFYPRYFEMLNGAVEDWFEQDLGLSFKDMHLGRRMGTPTVRLEAQFMAPSELGDVLTITITAREVGRSSCAITVLFRGDDRDRLSVDVVLVCMDLEARKSMPWPDVVRAKLQDQIVPAI